MSKLSRRETLAATGKAVAAAAVLTTIPAIAHAKDDAELLDLERQWYLAAVKEDERREAWRHAVRVVAPGQKYYSPDVFEIPHVKELSNLADQADREMRIIEDRMTETPARTIHGVAAKLRVGQGPVMMQAFRQSIVADAERLAGRAI